MCLVECLLYSKHPVNVGCLISSHSSLWNCPTFSSPAFWLPLSHSSPNPCSTAAGLYPLLTLHSFPLPSAQSPQSAPWLTKPHTKWTLPISPLVSLIFTCEPRPHFHCLLSPALGGGAPCPRPSLTPAHCLGLSEGILLKSPFWSHIPAQVGFRALPCASACTHLL